MGIYILGIIFIVAVIAYVVFLVRFLKKSKKGSTSTEEKEIVQKTILDLIPIVRYNTDFDCYEMVGDTYMDILQFQTKDLNSTGTDDREYDKGRFEKLFKILGEDCKIISLNYPCSTMSQQKYMEKKIQSTNNKQYLYWLEKSKKELEWLADHKTSREFYLMYFADSLDNQQKNKMTILNSLDTGMEGLICEISAEKKHNILYKLANQSNVI